MAKYSIAVRVSEEDWREGERLLRRKTPVRNGKDTLKWWGEHFPDGRFVDVNLCNGEGPYLDFVLYEKGGFEIACEVGESMGSGVIFHVLKENGGEDEYSVSLKKIG